MNFMFKPRYEVEYLSEITSPKSGRRTFSDLFLSLGAILLSIGWMQGAGTILGPGYLDIIGAPNQVSYFID